MNTIWSYIDGSLEPKEREAFERELAISEELRADVESARMLMSSLSSEPLAQTCKHFSHNVLVELSRQTSLAAKRKPKFVRYLVPSFAIVAALIVLVVVLVPGAGNSNDNIFSIRKYSDSFVAFFSSDISTLIVTLISCGYILILLDKMFRRLLLKKS